MDDGFKVNFSKSDLTSEASSYEAVPSGDYICNVTGIELAKVKNGNNAGKNMFKVEFTVDADNGEYVKRKFWSNIMLFEMEYRDGTTGNFILAQFLKATGNAAALTTGNVPSGPSFIGKKLVCVVTRKKQDPQYGEGFRNNIAGYRALEGSDEFLDRDSDLPS